MARCRPARTGPHRWIATGIVREQEYTNRPPTAYRLMRCERCGSRAWDLELLGREAGDRGDAWHFVGRSRTDPEVAFSISRPSSFPVALVVALFVAALLASIALPLLIGAAT